MQFNSVSRCLISPCKSLLDCNVFYFIYFDWSRSFWIRGWARLFVHGFCSGFLSLTKNDEDSDDSNHKVDYNDDDNDGNKNMVKKVTTQR